MIACLNYRYGDIKMLLICHIFYVSFLLLARVHRDNCFMHLHDCFIHLFKLLEHLIGVFPECKAYILERLIHNVFLHFGLGAGSNYRGIESNCLQTY